MKTSDKFNQASCSIVCTPILWMVGMFKSYAVSVIHLLLILGLAHAPSLKAVPSDVKTEYVPFCELIKEFEKYNETVVSTEAIYTVGYETSSLYLPVCPPEDNGTWAEFALTPSYLRPTDKNLLRALLNRDSRARIIIEGRFYGPRKIEPPAHVPPKIAELLRKGNSRWGHLNAYRFKFEILLIEKVSGVPADTAWGSLDSNDPKPEELAYFPVGNLFESVQAKWRPTLQKRLQLYLDAWMKKDWDTIYGYLLPGEKKQLSHSDFKLWANHHPTEVLDLQVLGVDLDHIDEEREEETFRITACQLSKNTESSNKGLFLVEILANHIDGKWYFDKITPYPQGYLRPCRIAKDEGIQQNN